MVAPLSPRRYEIRVTVDEETYETVVQLQDLVPYGARRDPAMIVAQR